MASHCWSGVPDWVPAGVHLPHCPFWVGQCQQLRRRVPAKLPCAGGNLGQPAPACPSPAVSRMSACALKSCHVHAQRHPAVRAYVSRAAASGAHARRCASQKWSVAEMQAQGCRILDPVPHHQEDTCWRGVRAWVVMLSFNSNPSFL